MSYLPLFCLKNKANILQIPVPQAEVQLLPLYNSYIVYFQYPSRAPVLFLFVIAVHH